MKKYLIILMALIAVSLSLWSITVDGASSEKKQKRHGNKRGNANGGRGKSESADRNTSETSQNASVRDGEKNAQSTVTTETARVEPTREPESADVGAELEYNIFDPDRSSRQSAETSVKPPEVDRIALVGALLTDNECVAFFQGSKSDFSGACSVGDKISDFEVQAIDTERIKLTDGKKSIELEVGQGLARTQNGEWEISEETFSVPVASNAAETTSPQASADHEKKDGSDKATESKGSNSSEDEILKKMMERRKQETK